uniref:Multifunctional methyltransferase subunit TRM112-like protein n=1 Tax=Trichuris muris TaxID=70415 RepID=A0A5S6QWT9_TRIMR
MKLLVHNFLSSKFLKGVLNGYPLKLVATKVTRQETDFQPAFLVRMVPRLDWAALRMATQSVVPDLVLPEALPDQWESDEPFLRSIHRALMETEIEEGVLQCPETGREFTISEGIPNMLAREDELA